ncbi:MAG: hypothetical protein AAGF11_17940 [Myxococcota bacterium]
MIVGPCGTHPRATRRILPVALAVVASGCFGDWVSAVVAPRREAPTPTPTLTNADEPADPSPAEPSAEPCASYLAEVARRCDAVFDGHLGSARCHAQIVRVTTLLRAPAPTSAERKPSATEQARACTQYLRTLPSFEPSNREPTSLGPTCRRWAESLRERCVAPLSTRPVRLEGCGASLLAFESILGGITFGRADDYEPQCKRELERSGG